jgi:uncharacterized protein (DUF3084 family)
MTSAYILIAAILILGGLIAALGDRLGTKVGKQRLTLFNLRPKQTAILVTIITGTIISASTLGILFGLSGSLRKGVFQLDEILQKRRHVQAELEEVTKQKNQVEKELKSAEKRQREANQRLNNSEKELKTTQSLLKEISNQANQLKNEVKKILQERKLLINQQNELKKQQEQLKKDVAKKDRELQLKQAEITAQEQILKNQENQLKIIKQEQKKLENQINTKDEQIAQLDKQIAFKDNELSQRELRLVNLEKELLFLQREVAILDQYYQTYQELREKQIALLKGQVLAIGLLQIVESDNLQTAIDELLRQANRTAIEALGKNNYRPNQRLVQITKSQVEQLQQELESGGSYLVRILSAGNYVKGEKEVRVFADISLNKKIYARDQLIAKVSIEPENITETELQERLDFLLAVSQFRARRSGVLGTIQVGDGNLISVLNLINKIQEYGEPIDEIQAIATETTYTSGPLFISLVVLKDGEEVLRL